MIKTYIKLIIVLVFLSTQNTFGQFDQSARLCDGCPGFDITVIPITPNPFNTPNYIDPSLAPPPNTNDNNRPDLSPARNSLINQLEAKNRKNYSSLLEAGWDHINTHTPSLFRNDRSIKNKFNSYKPKFEAVEKKVLDIKVNKELLGHIRGSHRLASIYSFMIQPELSSFFTEKIRSYNGLKFDGIQLGEIENRSDIYAKSRDYSNKINSEYNKEIESYKNHHRLKLAVKDASSILTNKLINKFKNLNDEEKLFYLNFSLGNVGCEYCLSSCRICQPRTDLPKVWDIIWEQSRNNTIIEDLINRNKSNYDKSFDLKDYNRSITLKDNKTTEDNKFLLAKKQMNLSQEQYNFAGGDKIRKYLEDNNYSSGALYFGKKLTEFGANDRYDINILSFSQKAEGRPSKGYVFWNKNLVLSMKLTKAGKDRGFLGFSNFASEVDFAPNVEGMMMRMLLNSNGYKIPYRQERLLASLLEFRATSNDKIDIYFSENWGDIIVKGGLTQGYVLNNLNSDMQHTLDWIKTHGYDNPRNFTMSQNYSRDVELAKMTLECEIANYNGVDCNFALENLEKQPIAFQNEIIDYLDDGGDKRLVSAFLSSGITEEQQCCDDEAIIRLAKSMFGTIPVALANKTALYYNYEYNSLSAEHAGIWSESKIQWTAALNTFQTGLDLIGMIPGPGEIVDLVNGGIYLIRGDIGNAVISGLATIPLGGQIPAGSRFLIRIKKAANGKKVAEVIAKGIDEIALIKNFSDQLSNVTNRLRNGARFVNEGTGAFKKVRGHHPLAKKAFENAQNYDLNEAFSVSVNALKQIWKDVNPNLPLPRSIHSNITGNQNRLYTAWKKAFPNTTMTIDDMAEIELKAMTEAGIPENVAKGWVVKALEDIKSQGVSEIKNIPWNGINP